MHEYLDTLLDNAQWPIVLLLMGISITVLGKGADWLVEEAVSASLRSGIPRVVVGATAVSLGTTAPEVVVSVLAAVNGKPGLAMGNAVGSIICDTGLILGLACIIAPLPIDRRLVNRQGWIQFGSGVLLVLCCIPWYDPPRALSVGARLPQVCGWGFLVLLVMYLIWSVRLASASQEPTGTEQRHFESHRTLPIILARLAVSVCLVLVSSALLIASATELAHRLHVPESVIAATMVAFGTSLPELIVCTTAVLKKHGELAIGNVIGADILNVLFVAGASAAVTRGGLVVEPHFFHMQFPAMLFILIVFRIGIWRARHDALQRPFGVILLAAYVVVTLISFFVDRGQPS